MQDGRPSRTIVIGDIHGCLAEFDELLRKVEFRRGHDDLVLLGDLMDRGPSPVGVVRRARELSARVVMGNHDEKHLRWRRHEAKVASTPGYRNPMRRLAEKSLAENSALSGDDVAWMRALPLTLEIAPQWLAVHAGFEPALPLAEQRPDKVMRIRYVDAAGKMTPITNDIDQPEGTQRWAVGWKEPVHVVYGHFAKSLSEPLHDVYTEQSGRQWHRFGIDTGCCFGGRLTALVMVRGAVLPQMEFVSVAAHGVYAQQWLGDPA